LTGLRRAGILPGVRLKHPSLDAGGSSVRASPERPVTGGEGRGPGRTPTDAAAHPVA